MSEDKMRSVPPSLMAAVDQQQAGFSAKLASLVEYAGELLDRGYPRAAVIAGVMVRFYQEAAGTADPTADPDLCDACGVGAYAAVNLAEAQSTGDTGGAGGSGSTGGG